MNKPPKSDFKERPPIKGDIRPVATFNPVHPAVHIVRILAEYGVPICGVEEVLEEVNLILRKTRIRDPHILENYFGLNGLIDKDGKLIFP